MYPPHDQAGLPRQVDNHCRQDRLLPAVGQQLRMAGHLALPVPARQELRVGSISLFFWGGIQTQLGDFEDQGLSVVLLWQ